MRGFSEECGGIVIFFECSASDGLVLPGIYRGITALLIFVIGLWVSRVIARLLSRVLVKRKIDQTFIDFSVDMLKSMIVLLVIVIVLSQLGVPTASLVAIIGAMGLAVGLSLKSSLSNLASGFIDFISTFKVGDVIDIKGSSGVQSIQIMFTYIDTADGELVCRIPRSCRILLKMPVIRNCLEG